MALGPAGRAQRANSSQGLRARADARSAAFAILDAMSNRQARRQQNRQARRQATSYRGGRSRGSSEGSGGSGGSGGGGRRGSNFLSWPFLAGVSLLAAALLALVIVFALRDGGGGEGEPTSDVGILDQELERLPTELQSGNKLGRDDAPAKLIQYEDFRCPHCLSYTVNNEGFLIEEFVKPGLLQIEFRHLPVLGDASVRAAVGASCAAKQDRLFEYANRLFALHAENGTASDLYEEDKLGEMAGELGLDTEAFAACQAAPDSLSQVSADIGAAREIGFQSTPSFTLNGVPIQVPLSSNERWREIIQEVIDIATAEDEPETDGEPDAEDDATD